MDFVEKEFGISKGHQLILRGEDGKQLEASMNLEEFFKKDSTVYLYVIKGQAQDNAHDDFEVIGGLSLEKRWSESIMQFIPSFYESHLGSNVKDILESNYVGYYNELMSYFSDIKNELNVIKDGSIKLKRQKVAEEIAKKNLSNYYVEKKKKFDDTISERETKIELIQQYIDNFDSSLAKLAKKEIDPQLGEEDKKYLIDYFDTEKLKIYRANYEKNQIKIKQKAQEIKDEIVQYDTQLQGIEGAIRDNSIEIQNLLTDQETLYVDIQDTNIQGFKNLVEEKKGNPTQKDLSDFVKKEYENSLPKLKEISQELAVIKDKLEDQLKENAVKLKELISDILNLRVIIKGKIYNKLKVFCSLVDKHAEQIFNLEIIEKFPLVYEQSLIEIKRRIIYKKDYMTILNILERFADSENRMRQEFLEVYQQYLPKSFCPFLSKTFPQLNFESIRRMIDQDVGVDFNDSTSNKGNAESDMLKLLQNLNNNLETKDNKNKELENLLEEVREENEKLKEQMERRIFSVTNLRRLLGASGFQEKIDDFLGSYKQKVSEKIDQIEKRVMTLQNDKLDFVNKTLSEHQEKLKLNNENEVEKITELETLIKEKDNEIKSLSELIHEKELANKKLEKHRTDIQNELEESLRKNEAFIEKNKALKGQQLQLITEKEDLIEKMKKLEQEIASLTQIANELSQKENEEKSKNTQDLDKKEAELKEAQANLSVMRKEKEKFNDKIREKDGKILQLEKVIMETQKQISIHKKENANLEALGAEKDKKLASVNVSLKKAQTNVEKLTEELKESEKKFKETQESLNVKTKALTETEQKLDALNKEIIDLRSALGDQSKEKDSNKDKEIKKLTKEIANLKNQLKTKEKDYNTQLEEQQCEFEELRKTLVEKENELQTHEFTLTAYGELGGKILGIYCFLFGKDDPKLNKELDLSEALEEILRFMKTSMVKIDEFRNEDRVLAVKINDTEGNYLVIKMEQAGIKSAYVFKSQGLSDIIVGEISSFGEYEYDTSLVKKLGAEIMIPVNLVNVEAVSPMPIHKLKEN